MSHTTDATTKTTHIQGVGQVPAVQAQQLVPGDQVMWNGGHVVEVLAVEEASPCFLRVRLTSSTPGDTKPDIRRWKKTAIIGVQSAQALAPATATTTTEEPEAGEQTEPDFYTAVKASGLQLGDLVEYDGRTVNAPENPQFLPGGRGRLRDIWAAGGELVARVEREDGSADAPVLKDLRPATTTVLRNSSELRQGDVVRYHGMRVRLDELNCPPYTGYGQALVYSWRGTVLNLHDVHAEGHVPKSFLRRWEGSRLVREDVWTVQGNESVQWSVEVPEISVPKPSPAPRTITVTTATTRKSLPVRLREAGAPGEMVTNNDLGGVLRWRLPNGNELTPGQAAEMFLS